MARSTVILALAASCVSLLSGCEAKQYFGAIKQAEVPYDPHAQQASAPDPIEVAANPCKYGDAVACMAKCQAGDSSACNAIGVIHEFSDADGEGASAFYARACDASYAPGCTNLGWLYSLGRGVPRDPSQAMALFTRAYEASRLACRRGDASGCMSAAQALLDGRGVEANETDALAYFQRACDAGERKGCDYVTMLR